MMNLITFIFGIAFVVVIMPIAQSLTNTICAYIDVLGSKAQTKIQQSNYEIAKTQNEIESLQPQELADCNGQPMGFRLEDFDDGCKKITV